jgi:putative tryptophan/tyrosine transport system substrate-binding protein
MRRRDFMAVLAGATTVGTRRNAVAQQTTRVWRIVMLDTAPRHLNGPNLEAFYKRLQELGYVEGENLKLDYRSADGRNEHLPHLVSELVDSRPDIIVLRGTPEALAVKNAATTISVVMSAVNDPVGIGVAASLRRPGGNFTGMSVAVTELGIKRAEYLKEIVPGLKRIAFLGDLRNPAAVLAWDNVQRAGRSLGIDTLLFDVRSAEEVSRAFEAAFTQRVQGLQVSIDGTTRPNRRLIVDLAASYKLPAIYTAREFIEAGGLISYATDYAHLYSRAATFVDRIFKGANPAELPIERPTKFELVINLKTAKALGLDIPPTILARADEVIE